MVMQPPILLPKPKWTLLISQMDFNNSSYNYEGARNNKTTPVSLNSKPEPQI
jgi:hypothetical protein